MLLAFAFALVSFLAAGLLFLLEPMTAKSLLPILGGAPGVWNTCVLFFQFGLLGGYSLAHALVIHLPARLRLVMLAVGYVAVLGFLPFDPSDSRWVGPLVESHPTLWILSVLTRTIGLPFLIVATTAPTIQNWYATTRHQALRDPYLLYSSSNLGGLLALLAYPVLVEPNLTLTQQEQLWAWGYRIFLGLMFGCGMATWRTLPEHETSPTLLNNDLRPTTRQLGKWVALAFVPSSLMLGVTTYLSTDIAAIPLLWILPLALYQLSFILVFSRRTQAWDLWCLRCLPVLILTLAIGLGFGLVQMWWIPLHLLTFFVVSIACHGQLARNRPEPRFLTQFYLALCVGGVLGGVFNSLLAPVILDRIAEYPLALVLSLLVLPGGFPRSWRECILPLVIGLSITVAATEVGGLGDSLLSVVASMLAIGLIVFVVWKARSSTSRFALTLGAALVASGFADGVNGRLIYRERSFFGTLRVTESDDGQFRRFFHGSTLHGLQSLDPDQRREPLAYFTKEGPFGQIFEAFLQSRTDPHVAIVGLGAGAMATYAQPGQSWTFYELDPSVARVASNPAFFTFLSDCQADRTTIVLGDARLKLRDVDDHSLGLIVLDAFSSDAIPVHLLTREALELYGRKLADRGLIAFQITNRYLDLEPILGAVAAEFGLVCRVSYDLKETRQMRKEGRQGSIWAVLARDELHLGPIQSDPRWLQARASGRPWTDQYSNLLDALPRSRPREK